MMYYSNKESSKTPEQTNRFVGLFKQKASPFRHDLIMTEWLDLGENRTPV